MERNDLILENGPIFTGQGKALNACRILEKTVAQDPPAAGPVAEFLNDKRDDWPGARIVYAAVLAAASPRV